jgi:F0F1-type ATP synthase membrane subunit c/vacuolar-type H+-ATPase subunit K
MKKTRYWPFLLLAATGVALFYVGRYVLTAEGQATLSSWCVGLGATALAIGMGEFITKFVQSVAQTPESVRRQNIELSDERNTRIRERVAAKVGQAVNYALFAELLVMIFSNVDTIAIFMIAVIFLLEAVMAAVLTVRYSKSM